MTLKTEYAGNPAPAYRPGARMLGNMQLDPDPASEGGAGAGAAAETIPRAEAQKAFEARDAAKREAKAAKEAAQQTGELVKALAGKLGIDAADLKLIKTDDGFDVEGEPLTEVATLVTEGRKAKVDGLKKKGDWETREKELSDSYKKAQAKQHEQHQALLKDVTEKGAKRAGGLEKYIRRIAVEDRLRAAAHAAEAIDESGDGRFGDIVQLVRSRVKDEIAVDEETGEVSVNVTILSEDGSTPLMKAGKAATERDLMDEFLAKRPHLKKSRAARGPGAGGYGSGAAAAGGRTATLADRGTRAADAMFGKLPD